MDTSTFTARDLLKTEGILTGTPDETLAHALTSITRTHDAVFVFDDNKKFLGVINPYYTIFKSSFPPETKLEHCLFHPPVITAETTLWDVARLMAESKLYYLPVMENHTFLGIVTINRLLRGVLKNTALIRHIRLDMRKNVVTIHEDATLQDAHTAMRDKQISRLPIINKQGRAVGIVTRYDIREAFTKPQERPHFLSRIGEKEPFMQKPISKYSKKLVITVSPDTSPSDIVNTLADNNIGSVIVQDAQYRPVGIISTHDILKAIALQRPQRESLLEVATPDDFVGGARLDEILALFMKKIGKFTQIRKFHMSIQAEKNAAGKASRYKVHAQLLRIKGGSIISHTEEHDWKKAVHEVLDKIQKQLKNN